MHTITAAPAPVTDPDPRPGTPYFPLPDSPWPVIQAAADRILAGLPAVP